MNSRVSILVKLAVCFFIEKIDLENKRIFLKYYDYSNNTPTFSILLASYLISLKKGEFKYYIRRREFTSKICDRRLGNFVVLNEECTLEFIVGNLRLDVFKLEGIGKYEEKCESDFIVYKKKNSLILSNDIVRNPDDELGLLNSFLVNNKNWLGNRLGPRGYNIISITEHHFNTTKHDLKLSLWLTRDGNSLYLGNEKDDLSGALGLNLFPYYYYPKLKDGESSFVDIICKRLV